MKVSKRGNYGQKIVDGIRPGTYTHVGDDSNGMYFLGHGDCIILLFGERADRFIATGEIDPLGKRRWKQGPASGGLGGIFLPHEGSEKKPRLFYILQSTTDGSHAGIVGIAGTMMAEGAFEPVPFESEQSFWNSIKITDQVQQKSTCDDVSHAPTGATVN